MKKQIVLTAALFLSCCSYSSVSDACKIKMHRLSRMVFANQVRIAGYKRVPKPLRIKILKSLSTRNSLDHEQEQIIAAARKEGGREEAAALINLLNQSPSDNIKEKIADSAEKIGGAEGLRIIDLLLNDNPSDSVIRAAAYSAGFIENNESARTRILREILLLLDGKKFYDDILKVIIRSAEKIGGEEGAGILAEVIKKNLSDITLWNAGYSIAQLDAVLAVKVLTEWLNQDTLISEQTKQAIAHSAGLIGGEQARGILVRMREEEANLSLEETAGSKAPDDFLLRFIDNSLEKIEKERRENGFARRFSLNFS